VQVRPSCASHPRPHKLCRMLLTCPDTCHANIFPTSVYKQIHWRPPGPVLRGSRHYCAAVQNWWQCVQCMSGSVVCSACLMLNHTKMLKLTGFCLGVVIRRQGGELRSCGFAACGSSCTTTRHALCLSELASTIGLQALLPCKHDWLASTIALQARLACKHDWLASTINLQA